MTLTEEAFWEILRDQAPGEYHAARELIRRYRNKPGIIIDPGEGSIVVRLDIQDTGEQASLFFINRPGRVIVWPPTIRGQLERAEVPLQVLEPYESELREIMGMGEERVEFGREVSEVDLAAFTDSVDAFIERVQTAALVDG